MAAKNLMDLTGRVAVVIGGTSGIGCRLALGLAEAGAGVVATGRGRIIDIPSLNSFVSLAEVAAYTARQAGYKPAAG